MNINLFGYKCRLEMMIAFVVLGMVIGCSLYCNCSREGLENKGSDINDSIGDGNQSSWENKANDYADKMNHDNKLDRHSTYTGTPVPLQEGELFFFSENDFKPECCGASYSSSTGCACTSQEQIDYLNTRGGNRTAPSQF